jgi:DNA repair exonuclease SbcCD ATPase subunit
MWIERITMNRFQVFDTATVEFAPGLNVIGSPNEGGKSSLLRAVVAVLFGDAASRSAETRAFTRWGNDAGAGLEMELWIGDSCYRIEKDFEARRQAVYRRDTGELLAEGKGVGEFLRSRLPLADENLFMRVCGVRHEELGSVCDGGTSIGERLEEILGGGWGQATPDRIKQMLEGKRTELLKGVGRPALPENWGPVKRLREAVASGERELGEAVAASKRREELLRSLSIIDADIEALDAKLAALDEKVARAKQRSEIARKVDEAKVRADGLRKRIDRLTELGSRREELAARDERRPAPLRGLDAASLEERRRDVLREASLEKDIALRPQGSTRLPAGSLTIAGVLIVAGVIGGLLWNPWALAAAGLGVALVLALLIRGALMGGPALAREKRRELAALVERRRGWAGERSLDDALKLLDDLGAREDERRRLDIRIEEASGGPIAHGEGALERLDAEYGAASRELRGVEEELRELDPFALDADALLALERDGAVAKRDRERLRGERATADRALAALPAKGDGEIRERIESAREALGFVERRVAVIEAILEVLGEARSQMSGFLAGKLPPLAAEYLSRMTDGRYRALFVDPVRLTVETVPAAGDIGTGDAPKPERVAPEELSQGARDQIHLAVRLALVNLMSEVEPQPLFLDDLFVHFDPARKDRALAIVRDFASRHQVMLLTCDPEYREIGGRYIELADCRAGGSAPRRPHRSSGA